MACGRGPTSDRLPLSTTFEQLRQLIKRSLADEGSDAGHARVSLRYKLRCGRIALIDIHGAELVDFDQLVIETVAFLLEQQRPPAVELDGERRNQHERRRKKQDGTA